MFSLISIRKLKMETHNLFKPYYELDSSLLECQTVLTGK
jgi:hypothetical protein